MSGMISQFITEQPALPFCRPLITTTPQVAVTSLLVLVLLSRQKALLGKSSQPLQMTGKIYWAALCQ